MLTIISLNDTGLSVKCIKVVRCGNYIANSLENIDSLYIYHMCINVLQRFSAMLHRTSLSHLEAMVLDRQYFAQLTA